MIPNEIFHDWPDEYSRGVKVVPNRVIINDSGQPEIMQTTRRNTDNFNTHSKKKKMKNNVTSSSYTNTGERNNKEPL
jgi:hypothetical protein